MSRWALLTSSFSRIPPRTLRYLPMPWTPLFRGERGGFSLWTPTNSRALRSLTWSRITSLGWSVLEWRHRNATGWIYVPNQASNLCHRVVRHWFNQPHTYIWHPDIDHVWLLPQGISLLCCAEVSIMDHGISDFRISMDNASWLPFATYFGKHSDINRENRPNPKAETNIALRGGYYLGTTLRYAGPTSLLKNKIIIHHPIYIHNSCLKTLAKSKTPKQARSIIKIWSNPDIPKPG